MVNLTKEEWLKRYIQYLIEKSDMTLDAAESYANNISYEDSREDFENDPEAAAAAEMSYWDSDDTVYE